MLRTVVTVILFYLINDDKMADFVTAAVVDDVGLSGCMNHPLEVETDHGATKQTKSKINIDHRSFSSHKLFYFYNYSFSKDFF